MDTVLNLGINDEVAETLAKKANNPRWAWDSYRRFVQMYGDVVLGMKPENKDDIDPFEAIIEEVKAKKGVKFDTELEVGLEGTRATLQASRVERHWQRVPN